MGETGWSLLRHCRSQWSGTAPSGQCILNITQLEVTIPPSAVWNVAQGHCGEYCQGDLCVGLALTVEPDPFKFLRFGTPEEVDAIFAHNSDRDSRRLGGMGPKSCPSLRKRPGLVEPALLTGGR